MGVRSRRREKARARYSSYSRHARSGSRIRTRMGECVHVSMRTARTTSLHDRVIFVGDAAHQVSPFGARGGNSGIQDADNLCWKLARVVHNESPASLLRTFDDERVEAANENILNSSRSTDFITPKSGASRRMRDAVLALSQQHPFARRLVNSGRLSTPTVHRSGISSTPDHDSFNCGPTSGAPAVDAPVTVKDRERVAARPTRRAL